jgi:4-diphosphocytidyl-2-C-methyl-D-erythritol kinase
VGLSGRVARVAAPAKVNLLLRVLRRRPDGFHELATVFQAVSLSDEVEVELGGIGVGLAVEGAELGPPEENLAVRAVRAFQEAAGGPEHVQVRLRKEVPAGAGLGGGSSDAAAVLRALQRLTGSPLEDADLLRLGAGLGSDVPFFLGPSPLAAATGRGERLRPWSPLPPAWLVLVLPPVHVSTAAAYAALAEARAAREPSDSGEGSAVLPREPAGWDEVVGWMENDFEAVVPGRHPPVDRALAALRETGDRRVLLSGSGGACFALVSGGEEGARRAARSAARALGWPVRAVRTLARLPPVETDGDDRGLKEGVASG